MCTSFAEHLPLLYCQWSNHRALAGKVIHLVGHSFWLKFIADMGREWQFTVRTSPSHITYAITILNMAYHLAIVRVCVFGLALTKLPAFWSCSKVSTSLQHLLQPAPYLILLGTFLTYWVASILLRLYGAILDQHPFSLRVSPLVMFPKIWKKSELPNPDISYNNNHPFRMCSWNFKPSFEICQDVAVTTKMRWNIDSPTIQMMGIWRNKHFIFFISFVLGLLWRGTCKFSLHLNLFHGD